MREILFRGKDIRGVWQDGGLRWTRKRRPEVDLYLAKMKIRFEVGNVNE